eukprot:3934353-Rhodomonas_salina.1
MAEFSRPDAVRIALSLRPAFRSETSSVRQWRVRVRVDDAKYEYSGAVLRRQPRPPAHAAHVEGGDVAVFPVQRCVFPPASCVRLRRGGRSSRLSRLRPREYGPVCPFEPAFDAFPGRVQAELNTFGAIQFSLPLSSICHREGGYLVEHRFPSVRATLMKGRSMACMGCLSSSSSRVAHRCTCESSRREAAPSVDHPAAIKRKRASGNSRRITGVPSRCWAASSLEVALSGPCLSCRGIYVIGFPGPLM